MNIVKHIAILVLLGLLLFCFAKITNAGYLAQYNEDYINKYFADNMDGCVIQKIERHIHVSDFLGNTHLEATGKDEINKVYSVRYYIYDEELDYRYELVFGHNKNEKIALQSSQDRNYYRERKKTYMSNYDKIKEIIRENGGKTELLNKYKDAEIDKYILLVYVPNIDTATNIQNELYDKIHGGYAGDHEDVTNGINVSFPRYVFVNDRDILDKLKANSKDIMDYTEERTLECHDSLVNDSNTDRYILMKNVVHRLFDENIECERFRDRNTTITLKDDELPSKWCVTFELETGVDYYTDVYTLQ